MSCVKMIALSSAVIVSAAFGGCSNSSTPIGPSPGRSSAAPQSWAVVAGSQSGNQAYQALAYYPNSITVDAGDTVTWTVNTDEPHTISFPIPGTTPVPPTNASAQSPAGTTTFDGSTYDSSGFILGGKTYALTFTKPGTYTYYSLPQLPLVSGTVVVQAAGSAYPLVQSAIASAGASTIAADITSAEQAVSSVPYTPGSNQIAAGISATKAGSTSTVMRFLAGPTESDDLSTTITAGTTLTFKNLSDNVPHTVTIPAAGASPPPGPPFQAASGGNTYNGTQLVNSGVIPPGGTFSVTFTTAGTYPYYCLFHAGEGMLGSITVTPAGS